MMVYYVLLQILLLTPVLLVCPFEDDLFEFSQKIETEEDITKFLNWYDIEKSQVSNCQAKTLWIYKTNITSHNEKIMKEGRRSAIKFMKKAYKLASKIEMDKVKNESMRRQLLHVLRPGEAVLPDDKLDELLSLEAKMLKIHTSAKACIHPNYCFDDKDIMDIFANSQRESTLRYFWLLWHNEVGRQIKDEFKKHVKLSNEVAHGNHFSDMGSYWRSSYELANFEDVVKNLWDQMKPLYMQLHAYVRKKLIEIYGPTIVPRNGLIPAHLLGDLLEWIVAPPFTDPSTPHITREMEKKNYTVMKIVKDAEDFFLSLGFPPLPYSFWNNSMFEKKNNEQNAMCHGTAWNFHDKNDFRMLICAKVSVEEWYTIHHEMGHLHYFMAYKDQPYPFRDGANPAFHEAIGDVILLSVMTPTHLKSIGLLEHFHENYGNEINFLFMKALSSFSTIPLSYVIDRWRWDIFTDKYDEAKWNEEWWNLRKDIQGLSPPAKRSERDFDAGIIYHVAAFTPYTRYFLSEVLKYQFHRALCKAAGLYNPNDSSKPLFKCDIYGSKRAGNLLRNMLQLGSSKHWTYAMEVLTQGEEHTFNQSALIDYFEPLIEYLTLDNQRTGEVIGWEEIIQASDGKSFTSHFHFIFMVILCIIIGALLSKI